VAIRQFLQRLAAVLRCSGVYTASLTQINDADPAPRRKSGGIAGEVMTTFAVNSINRKNDRSVIRTGRLLVDLEARVASIGDQPVRLTPKEYAVLELLCLRKGATLTKEMFLDHLYGRMNEPEPKIIDVFVCKLRKKIAKASGGSHYIETIWGRGYVLRDPDIIRETIKLPANATS
jgi:DNA-binding response OmpR family regulator